MPLRVVEIIGEITSERGGVDLSWWGRVDVSFCCSLYVVFSSDLRLPLCVVIDDVESDL